MRKFEFKKINFVMRIMETEKKEFKFDILYKDDLVITNNINYNTINECTNALSNYLINLYNMDSNDHLIVNFDE